MLGGDAVLKADPFTGHQTGRRTGATSDCGDARSGFSEPLHEGRTRRKLCSFILNLNYSAFPVRLLLPAMASALFDSSAFFSTEYGAVFQSSADRYRVTLGERTWVLAPDRVRALHEALQPLAAQVYRCNCDCRWQVRSEGHETLVLSTDEVLRLHSLLDGAVAMLELDILLDDAGVCWHETRVDDRG